MTLLRPTRRSAVVLLLTVSVLLGACGDDADGEPQGQVSPGVSTFVGADLDDVPLPPLAEPLGPVDELDGGMLVRSFEVRDRTPEEVMDFYEDQFADAEVVMPPENATGEGEVFRAEWQLEDGVIRITTQRAPAIDGEDGSEGVSTQLSMQLTPDE